jgi:hypothetical protein
VVPKARFDVSTAMKIQVEVFWVVTISTFRRVLLPPSSGWRLNAEDHGMNEEFHGLLRGICSLKLFIYLLPLGRPSSRWEDNIKMKVVRMWTELN